MKTLIERAQQRRRILAAVLTASALTAPALHAQSAEEFNQLKALVEQLQKTIDTQNQRISDLEKQKGAAPSSAPTAAPGATTATPPSVVANSPSIQVIEKAAAGEAIGQKSPVTYRGAMNDQQEAASRPKDYTLDPTYQGFIPVPNTGVLIKFNAKPHLDMTWDNKNPGNQNRFVPAVFPLEGSATESEDGQFNANANATQLRLDVRAPEMAGNFRFYYQNDFFGSGSDTGNMKYRVQHLYGQLYGFKAGFTYGVWEDPDSWPDTVDYEGPNAVIFSRRPVAQYTHAWNDNWNTTFGVEEPDIYVDINSGPNPGTAQLTRIPDLGFNTRFEKEGFGHLQFSTMIRELGARDGLGEEHYELGWGVNLSAGIDLTENDFLQVLGVYGEGVGGMGNDTSFLNSDAAFNPAGELEALPYWSVSVGYTHRWNDKFRSTVTYGYVNLDNTDGQAATFYHTSQYASANLIWQLRKRLSVGVEGLYGMQEARNGVESGDHFRLQVGMVYSLFD